MRDQDDEERDAGMDTSNEAAYQWESDIFLVLLYATLSCLTGTTQFPKCLEFLFILIF
jgi:hypothetical protein